MDSTRANWDPEVTRFFLDLCIAQKEKFNWEKQKLTRDGWRNVYRRFTETQGPIYTHKHMSNKLQTLKKRYTTWKELQNRIGLGRNKTTGAVEAEPELFGTEDDSQDISDPEESTETSTPGGTT